jgi:hypothetical protein
MAKPPSQRTLSSNLLKTITLCLAILCLESAAAASGASGSPLAPLSSDATGDAAARLADKSSGESHKSAEGPRTSIWIQGLPGALVSVVAALASYVYFHRNRSLSRQLADRTVTFEAQKLLLEINKQFLANPDLFAIYDHDEKNREKLQGDASLKEKVAALGFMKLNVFEIVYAQMPPESRDAAWKAYFLDSLDRCSVLGEELAVFKAIYHPNLIAAYDEWKGSPKKREERLAALQQRRLALQSPAEVSLPGSEGPSISGITGAQGPTR